MASYTIATLPRISSTELRTQLLESASSNLSESVPPEKLAIIDVRDDGWSPTLIQPSSASHWRRKSFLPHVRETQLISSITDHIGGHIKHSTHVPSATLDHAIPSLVRKLADKEVVVFHCALSQQRGPSAALRYIRERDRLQGFNSTAVGEAMKKNKEEEKEAGDEDGKECGWEDVERKQEKKEQKVYVLDRGFVGWQEVYGEDSRLTEGYRKEIWKDGY